MEGKVAVSCFTRDGKWVASFTSIYQAAKAFKGTRQNIWVALHEPGKTAYGYIWKEATQEEKEDAEVREILGNNIDWLVHFNEEI